MGDINFGSGDRIYAQFEKLVGDALDRDNLTGLAKLNAFFTPEMLEFGTKQPKKSLGEEMVDMYELLPWEDVYGTAEYWSRVFGDTVDDELLYILEAVCKDYKGEELDQVIEGCQEIVDERNKALAERIKGKQEIGQTEILLDELDYTDAEQNPNLSKLKICESQE